jgi:hypothetical protein
MPLLAGAIVYLLFRPVNPVSSYFHSIKRIPVEYGWLKWFLGIFPDFCWSYSLAFSLYLFGLHYKLNRYHLALAILFLLVFSEWVQLFFPHQFTFDAYDLLAAVFAFSVSTLQIRKIRYEKTN